VIRHPRTPFTARIAGLNMISGRSEPDAVMQANGQGIGSSEAVAWQIARVAGDKLLSIADPLCGARGKAKSLDAVMVPESGPGTYQAAKKSVRSKSSYGALMRYDVRVEDGLPIDPDKAAVLIQGVLDDPRNLTTQPRSAASRCLVLAVDRADKLCRVIERLVRGVDLSHGEDRGERLFERQQIAQLLLDQITDHPLGLRPKTSKG
jgi:hypothetical protein